MSGRQLRELLADDRLDELIDRAEQGGARVTGEGGFLPELVKAVLKRGLPTELSDHLGYEKGDPGSGWAGTPCGARSAPKPLDALPSRSG